MFYLIYNEVVSQKIIIGGTDFPEYTKIKIKDNNHWSKLYNKNPWPTRTSTKTKEQVAKFGKKSDWCQVIKVRLIGVRLQPFVHHSKVLSSLNK